MGAAPAGRPRRTRRGSPWPAGALSRLFKATAGRLTTESTRSILLGPPSADLGAVVSGVHGEIGGLAMHAWKLLRAALVTAVTGATLVAVPVAAQAVPPSSAIEVGTTSVARGQTFTVSQTVYNDRDFTITGGKAGLYFKETSLPAAVDLVSCPGAYACDTLGSSVRGGVADVPPGESRTVVFTFRVHEDAPLGTFTLQHQFIGENYAFDILDGPSLTIAQPQQDADVAVALGASVRMVGTARITYTITVKNN